MLETFIVIAMPDLDMIAQSTCGGLNKKEGFIYAVRRPCPGSETCEQICQSEELKAQDPQIKAKTGRCQSAIHVYSGRPPITGNKRLGPKIYLYSTCRLGGCGPNYCCCRFANYY